jgi:hypothetical protein
MEAAREPGAIPSRRLGQRTVVVSVDLRVAVVSPSGETVVPLEVEPVVVVTTPLTVVDFWLLVSVEVTGAGMAAGIVVDVVVVLEEEDCADAAPVISVTASVATNQDFIMSNSPVDQIGAGSLASVIGLV